MLQKDIGCPICPCLPPDRTRHKVNDPKVDYSVGLGEGKGRARAEARAQLDYDAARSAECGPAECRGPYGLKSALLECK